MKKLQEFDDCATRLKALADRDRLRILMCLLAGPRNVSDIAEKLGEELVNVSHHLAIMRRAKVLLATKHGRFVQYEVHPDVAAQLRNTSDKHIDFGCCSVDFL